MRIAIIADPLDNQSAGIHTYTRELIKALIRYDCHNEYILIRQRRRHDFPELKQVVIRSSKAPIGLASLRLFFILPIVFRRLKVDAVLEPAHFGPFGVPKRARRITVIHDLTPIKFPKWHRWHSQVLQKIFLKGILRMANLVISNSINTSKDLHELYPFTQPKTVTIPLGREESFKSTQDPSVLQNYGIPQPYFLFTGTIEPRKNLLVLLEAYRLFREDRPPRPSALQEGSRATQLVIAGARGWRSKAFFREVEQHPFRHDIKLIGFVPREDLPALYTQALAFIYPSLYEGFGLPVLEAMSCGTACIISNSSSLPEVGGGAALYFEPDDPAGLAAQMSRISMDEALRERISHQSVARANTFSWERYVLDFRKSLNKLVNRS